MRQVFANKVMWRQRKHADIMLCTVFYLCVLAVLFAFSYEHGIQGERVLSDMGYAFLAGLTCVLFVISSRSRPKTRLRSSGIQLFFAINIIGIVTVIYHWRSDPEGIRHAIVPITQVSMFLSLWWAVNKLKIDAVGYTYHLCIIFVIASTISLPPALYAYFHSHLAVGPLLIEQYAGGTHRYRLIGWYGSPNRLAPVLAIGVICTWHLVTNRPQFALGRGGQTMLLGCLIANVFGLILTGSRSAILGTVCAGAAYELLEKRRAVFKGDSWVKRLLAANLVLGAVWWLFSYIGYDYSFVGERVLRVTGTATDSLGTGSGRIGLWAQSVTHLQEASIVNLLAGYGYQYFKEQSGGSAAHSGYLAAAVGEGVPYVTALLLFVSYCYAVAFRTRKRSNRYVLGASLLTLLVIRNVFNSTFPAASFTGIAFVMSTFLILIEDSKLLNNGENGRTDASC